MAKVDRRFKSDAIRLQVLAFMEGKKRVRLFELYAAIGKNPDAIRSKVTKMADAGEVERLSPGIFRLPPREQNYQPVRHDPAVVARMMAGR